MLSGTRRHFLTQLSLMTGSSLLAGSVSGLNVHALLAPQVPAGPLWSTDAGYVKVSKGPWTVLPKMVPGVHLESLWIRMPDGVHLHALLYLPEKLSPGQKIPAVLETHPYRNTPETDDYMARHGYASIYLDVRGTGGSEGIPLDEYSAQEHEDTAHVIDWLSKQPWSNGNVGMHGVSYSAFNSVWVATAVKPPALKAIFVLAGTDNRYTDDIHYPGGSMLMVDNSWALMMVTMNVTPGAPEFNVNSQASLDRWNTPPWIQVFLRNQLDGPHWRFGSLAPDYGRLTTPTFLGGGYLDIYQNFVPRIMKNSPAPSKGILGTWHHSMTVPGPIIDWEAIRLRWFDHWLNGRDTGMMREPRVSFYMPSWRQQSYRYKGAIPGEWRHLNEWPETVFAPGDRLYLRPNPERPTSEVLKMDSAPGQGGSLADMSGPASALKLRYYPATGGRGQSFGPTPGEGYYGLDHREEDAWGMAFDTPPLREPIETLGFTRARLFVSSTAAIANWIVRLSDVAPDGTSYLISRGYLNGTHRKSHTNPEPLVPEEVYEIMVELWCAGYRFSPGHRIRIVVTNADFPVIWPSPYPMTTTLYTGGDRPSHVELPVLPKLQYLSATLPEPDPRDEAGKWRSGDWVKQYELTHDMGSGEHTAFFVMGDDQIWCRVKEDDPATASLKTSATVVHTPETSQRRVETRAEGVLSSTVDSFLWNIECTLLEDGKVVRSRTWTEKVRRELV